MLQCIRKKGSIADVSEVCIYADMNIESQATSSFSCGTEICSHEPFIRCLLFDERGCCLILQRKLCKQILTNKVTGDIRGGGLAKLHVPPVFLAFKPTQYPPKQRKHPRISSLTYSTNEGNEMISKILEPNDLPISTTSTVSTVSTVNVQFLTPSLKMYNQIPLYL